MKNMKTKCFAIRMRKMQDMQHPKKQKNAFEKVQL